jgi:hypothetical protein
MYLFIVETYIDLTNVSSEMLRWTISSFYWWRKPEYPEKTTHVKDLSLILINNKMMIQCIFIEK